MSHESKYVTNNGIDVIIDADGKEILKDGNHLEYILAPDNSPTGAGLTASPKATNKMISDQIYENVKEIVQRNSSKTEEEIKVAIIAEFSDKHIATEFGKESLLRLLSQEGCIGIRFTTCKSLKGRSIVAVGLIEAEENGSKISVPLKKEFYVEAASGQQQSSLDPIMAPLSEEEGVGLTTKKVLEDMGKDLTQFVNELKLGNEESIRQFSKKVTTTFFGFQ